MKMFQSPCYWRSPRSLCVIKFLYWHISCEIKLDLVPLSSAVENFDISDKDLPLLLAALAIRNLRRNLVNGKKITFSCVPFKNFSWLRVYDFLFSTKSSLIYSSKILTFLIFEGTGFSFSIF